MGFFFIYDLTIESLGIHKDKKSKKLKTDKESLCFKRSDIYGTNIQRLWGWQHLYLFLLEGQPTQTFISLMSNLHDIKTMKMNVMQPKIWHDKLDIKEEETKDTRNTTWLTSFKTKVGKVTN